MNQINVKTPTIVYVFLGVVALIIVLFVYKGINEKVTINETITSEEELAKVLEECASKYKTKVTFYTDMNPDRIDYDQIFHDIMAANTYIGCELYGFSYIYNWDAGRYKVKLTLKDPAAHRVFLTKIRVKQIAKHINYLDDYNKVKAVHDYIILSNEYSYTISSAFNALYVGKSACNGYAYSFYAIMKELGVPVTCEYGGNHAWNRVCIDGVWYNIDLTWDDKGGKNVSYEYFLKCDKDFMGHEHGGADAVKSLDVRGNSAEYNYKLIPNYRILLFLGVFTIFVIYLLFMKKLSDKRKNDALQEITFKEI